MTNICINIIQFFECIWIKKILLMPVIIKILLTLNLKKNFIYNYNDNILYIIIFNKEKYHYIEDIIRKMLFLYIRKMNLVDSYSKLIYSILI